MNTTKNIDLNNLNESIFKLIGRNWMLVCAGTIDNHNMMTASWGTCGILWNKPVAICFVRPQRYTFDFIEKADHFTLNFFDDNYREILTLLGTKSGRDIDKMKIKELTPECSENKTVFFKEAKLVLECKKLYSDLIKPELFLDDTIDKNYPSKDYHHFYIGEIVNLKK